MRLLTAQCCAQRMALPASEPRRMRRRAQPHRGSTAPGVLFWFVLPTASAPRHPSLHHTGGHECEFQIAACPAGTEQFYST